MGIVTAIFDFLANLTGLGRKRQELNNSPEIQANEQAKTDQKIKDEARAAIAAGDIDKIRKDAAE